MSRARCIHRTSRAPAHRSLVLQRLEERRLLSSDTLATASGLPFQASQTAHAADILSLRKEVELYRISLNAGDVVSAAISAQAIGSGLTSILRIFDTVGKPIALDDQEGGDPHLTFQASTKGNYFVGVSSAGNDTYNPNLANSGQDGATTGQYALDLQRTPGVKKTPDLTGSLFRLGVQAAAWGESVPVRFTVENRGGADAGAFDVELLVSRDQIFGAASKFIVLPQAIHFAGLAAGESSPQENITLTLPDLATAQAAGVSSSLSLLPVYLGLRIDPVGTVKELNPFDQVSVHRGSDWEKLTIVNPITSSGGNHSPATATSIPTRNNRIAGVLTTGQTDWYRINTISPTRVTAAVVPSGSSGFVPRLTLASSDGQVLIQSDIDPIAQQLTAGRSYLLAVTAVSGAGAYNLLTQVDIQTFSTTATADLQTGSPESSIKVGNEPESIVAADVNGDGYPDLIEANYKSYDLSVLLGNGDGSFQPKSPFTYLGGYPVAIAVADLNGDGKPDLVASSLGNNTVRPTVRVLLGNGDGSFQTADPSRTFDVDPGPESIAVADITGDGIPDLVVAYYGAAFAPSKTVSVLVGQADGGGRGNGHFVKQSSLDVGTGPKFVSVADLNGDGIPDLVVADYGTRDAPGNTISVLLGTGHGGFAAPTGYQVGTQPKSVAIADVDGNGTLDLIVADSGSNEVSVLLGNEDGSFRTATSVADGGQPVSVSVADLNGDQMPDIVVVNKLDGTITQLLGNGDGTFSAPRNFAAGDTPFGLAVADFNGDGRPDVAAVYIGANRANIGGTTVLLGNGDGTLAAPSLQRTGPNPKGIAVGDFNSDRRPDVVVANSSGDTVSVLLGNGDGTFQPREFQVGNIPSAVAVADLNGDGRVDLVVANSKDGTVGVLLGNGDGTFQSQRTYRVGAGPDAVVISRLQELAVPRSDCCQSSR